MIAAPAISPPVTFQVRARALNGAFPGINGERVPRRAIW